VPVAHRRRVAFVGKVRYSAEQKAGMRHEKALALAVVNADKVLQEASRAGLLAALRREQREAVFDQFPWERWRNALDRNVTPVVRDAFEAGAVAAEHTTFIRKQGVLEGTFDMKLPRAQRVAARRAAELVTNIDRSTRQAMRDIVTRAFRDNVSVRDQAKELEALLRGGAGLDRRRAAGLYNYEQKLRRSGLQSGVVAARVRNKRVRMLHDRAVTIARHETLEAAAAGQHETWMQAIDDKRLPRNMEREWITAQDERLCPICAPMNGQRKSMKEPFFSNYSKQKYMRPPAHVMCRCTIGLVEPKEGKPTAPSVAAPPPVLAPPTARPLLPRPRSVTAPAVPRRPLPPAVPRPPDSGLHELVDDLDLFAIDKGGPPIKYKRRTWDGSTETISDNISKSTLNARAKALAKAHAEAFGAKKASKVRFFFDEDEYYLAWRERTSLTRETIIREGRRPAPAVAYKGEVLIGPEISGRVAADYADIASDAWNVVAHELTHTVSGKAKALSSGLEKVVEEGGNEVLTKWFMSQRATPTVAKMEKFVVGGRNITGLDALARHTAYSEYTAEVVFNAARQVGWNRRAIIDEVARVFRLDEAARQQWFKLGDSYARTMGTGANVSLRGSLMEQARGAGVSFDRIKWTAGDMMGGDDAAEVAEAMTVAHNLILWLIGG
jgi:hypothetical protein